MARTPRRSPIASCALVFIVILVVILLAGYAVPRYITHRAEQVYGPAAQELGFFQALNLSTGLLLNSSDMTTPVDPGGKPVVVNIETGESVPAIARQLQDAGLISNPGIFRDYLQYAGLDTTLKAGEYKLSPSMTPIEIAQAIQSPISADVTLTILPGWRSEEIANALPTSGFDITAEEFFTAVHTPPTGYSFSGCLGDHSLEGYLSPASYTLPRGSTLAELLQKILANFETQLTPELLNGIAAQGLDVCQAVTLASIVQREAMVEDEMPLIASVFYNRLKNDSVLASDPTVQYALGYNQEQGTWWTNPLSKQDLQVDSPYNTYIYAGLPPGPISNPGLAALKAVAFPAQTPYYYFRAACDGSGRHVFSETFEEHVANACP